jgi:hypothetical protein
MKPARNTGPRARPARRGEDTNEPLEAEWADEPEAPAEPPAWAEVDTGSRWSL